MNSTNTTFHIPKEKDYRGKSEIHLNTKDIEGYATKSHPMQKWLMSQHKDKSSDECSGLPLPYILALSDAYLNYEKGQGKYKKGFATATYTISQEDPWFYCHFLGDPVMPGSQGQDAIFQLAGLWTMAKSEFLARSRALGGDFNFFGQILPYNHTVFYRIDIQRFLKKKRLLFFTGYIAVDEPDNIIYEFENCKMGFYTQEELGIRGNSSEYYQPDWQKVKNHINHYIELAKSFYEQRK